MELKSSGKDVIRLKELDDRGTKQNAETEKQLKCYYNLNKRETLSGNYSITFSDK